MFVTSSGCIITMSTNFRISFHRKSFVSDREKKNRSTEKVPEFRGLFKGLWQSLAVRFFGLETSHS